MHMCAIRQLYRIKLSHSVELSRLAFPRVLSQNCTVADDCPRCTWGHTPCHTVLADAASSPRGSAGLAVAEDTARILQ